MATDEYKLVPTSEFNKLATELEKIKDNPFLSKAQSKDMKVSIDVLHKSIGDLLDVFTQAHKEMTEEERETRILKKQLAPVLEQFTKVEDNQETIANGVVVVSDSITKLSHKVSDLHKRFDDVHTRMDRIEKLLKRLEAPDITKTTRKFYTTRQYPQQGSISSQDLAAPGLSPTPFGSPGMPQQFPQQNATSPSFTANSSNDISSSNTAQNDQFLQQAPNVNSAPALPQDGLQKKPGLFGK